MNKIKADLNKLVTFVHTKNEEDIDLSKTSTEELEKAFNATLGNISEKATDPYCIKAETINVLGELDPEWQKIAYIQQAAEQTIDIRKVLAALAIKGKIAVLKIKEKFPNSALTVSHLLFSIAIHLAKVTWGRQSKTVIPLKIPTKGDNNTLEFTEIEFDYVSELDIEVNTKLDQKFTPQTITRSRILAAYANTLINFFKTNVGNNKLITNAENAPILFRKYMSDYNLTKFAPYAFPNSFYGCDESTDEEIWAFLFVMAYRQSFSATKRNEQVGITKLLRVAQRRNINLSKVVEHINSRQLESTSSNVMLTNIIEKLITNRPASGEEGLKILKDIVSSQQLSTN
jgi:hypothetical protein